jgi:nucleoside-diphosphate kinase
MSVQKTLSIIKPDATARNLTGSINARFEQAGLRIIAQKRLLLTKEQAEKFYEVHKEKSFYDSLCEYMSSGPTVAQVLCGEDAVAKNREIMGATNPANAEIGTIRRDFGQSIEHNAVHGSDSPENAEVEIGFFFSRLEIIE